MTEYIYVVMPENPEAPSVLKGYRSRRTAFRIAEENFSYTKKVELIDKKFERSADQIRVPKKSGRKGNQKKKRSARKKRK